MNKYILAIALGSISPAFAQVTLDSVTWGSAPAVTITLDRPAPTADYVANTIATSFTIKTGSLISKDWFCIDPHQYIYNNKLQYASIDPADWNGVYDSRTFTNLQLNSLGFLFSNAGLYKGNTALSAALQIAIWELVGEDKDNPLNVGSGFLKITSGNVAGQNAIAQASTWLTSLSTAATTNAVAWSSALTADAEKLNFLIDGTLGTQQVQDLVSWDSQPVPESHHFAGGALGLLAIAAYVRRRKQSRSA